MRGLLVNTHFISNLQNAGAFEILQEKVGDRLQVIQDELDIDFNAHFMSRDRKMSSINLDAKGHVVVPDYSLTNDGVGASTRTCPIFIACLRVSISR